MRNILNVPESWRNGCMSSTREIILQACVFEMITQGIEQVEIRCMCCAHLDRRKKSDVSGCRIRFLVWIDRGSFMKNSDPAKNSGIPIFPG